MKTKLLLVLFSLLISQQIFAKSLIIGANPLGYAVGIGNVAVDIALGDSWTIGGEYQFLDDDEDAVLIKIEEEGNAYGARLRYFFDKAIEDSWVITAFGGTVSTDLTVTTSGTTSSTTTYSADGTYMGAMIGYHWQWDLLFMHLGLGYAQYSIDLETTSTTSTVSVAGTAIESTLDGGSPVLDFSIGLGF